MQRAEGEHGWSCRKMLLCALVILITFGGIGYFVMDRTARAHLRYAVGESQIESVRRTLKFMPWLANSTIENEGSLVHYAMSSSDLLMVRLLEQNGASLDVSALSFLGDTERLGESLQDDSSRCEERWGYRSEAPLHAAARTGQVEAIQVLLDYGADVDMKDSHAWTP